MEKPSKSSHGIALPIIIVIVLVLSAGGYFAYTNYGAELGLKPPSEEGPREIELPEVSPSPTTEGELGTPVPLKQGLGAYNISQPENSRPKIVRIEFDPLDVSIGQNQTITVRVLDGQPINNVALSVQSDNTTTQLSPELVEGNNLDGRWQTSWEVSDSLDYTYIVTITASGDAGTSNVEVAPRRPQ